MFFASRTGVFRSELPLGIFGAGRGRLDCELNDHRLPVPDGRKVEAGKSAERLGRPSADQTKDINDELRLDRTDQSVAFLQV